jgi:uncharacterized coiled-coil protein SlyX
MAKFEDYVKKPDQIEHELLGVEKRQPARTYNIPDSVKTRFAGKTPEEIMESFAEAQALISRQGSELGELRKTTANLLELQSKPKPQETPPPEPEKGITVDDLYENPERTIAKVVEKKSQKTSERIEALEKELAQRQSNDVAVSLERKYPGWQAEASKPEFLDWVKASPVRLRLARAADSYDLDSANDLFELWYERKGIVHQAQDQANREQQFRNASLETSGPVDVEQVPTFSRAEIQEQRIAAKHGNRKAERWLQTNGPAITLAYAEGRITD